MFWPTFIGTWVALGVVFYITLIYDCEEVLYSEDYVGMAALSIIMSPIFFPLAVGCVYVPWLHEKAAYAYRFYVLDSEKIDV